MTLALVLAIVLGLLQVFDGWSTYHLLTTRTTTSESNRVARWLFKTFGMLPTIIVSKTAFIGYGLYMAIVAPSVWWALAILVAWYSYVAFKNYKVLRD